MDVDCVLALSEHTGQRSTVDWRRPYVRRTVLGVSKTERIELRVSADDKDAIVAAATLEQTTTTEFVREAVLRRVQHVRARADRTLMPAEQFDALVAALDVPDITPNLARAFAHRRQFVQR